MQTDNGDSGRLRCFIGMPIQVHIRAALARAQAELRAVDVRTSWVAPEMMHLTAVFLGDIEPCLVDAIRERVSESLAGCPALPCSIRGLGSFGGGTPRVLWAGVGGDDGPLKAVQARLAVAARASGLVIEDRPYTPHVTLGRVRSARGSSAWLPVLTAHDTTLFGEQVIDAINLYQSHQEPAGAKYRVLHTWDLVGSLE